MRRSSTLSSRPAPIPIARETARSAVKAIATRERALRRLTRYLQQESLQVATAESCTGGALAEALTALPGSSHWFVAGWVVYSNAAKERDLGVQARTLLRHGAVSEPTVRELARSALARSGADVAVAISGIAGPGGAAPGKPVGTVWLGFARREGGRVRVAAVCKRFRGDRLTVRARAVLAALNGLYSMAKRSTLYSA